MTPLKSKLGPLPRNSSAPHFIDPKNILPRNVSTPGFGKIGGKFNSRESSHAKFFGIEVGSNTQLSNTQLYLEPSSSISINRRDSVKSNSARPMVRPFSRKDLFYGGSVSHLVETNELPANWDQYRPSIISIPRYKGHNHILHWSQIRVAQKAKVGQIFKFRTVLKCWDNSALKW